MLQVKRIHQSQEANSSKISLLVKLIPQPVAEEGNQFRGSSIVCFMNDGLRPWANDIVSTEVTSSIS